MGTMFPRPALGYASPFAPRPTLIQELVARVGAASGLVQPPGPQGTQYGLDQSPGPATPTSSNTAGPVGGGQSADFGPPGVGSAPTTSPGLSILSGPLGLLIGVGVIVVLWKVL